MTDIAPIPELPVAIIGAGPVGLAAAAHVIAREMEPLVFEAGATPAAAVSAWGHIGLFSPWKYNIDQAARALLEPTGWVEPAGDSLPTGAELVTDYLAPLAATPQLSGAIRTQTRVIAVSRVGKDRTRTPGRGETPFLVRTQNERGEIEDHFVRAVIDASGTWETPNPLGQAGLPALGENEAREAGLVTSPLPDVLGRDRAQFAGRHTLVVGAGHSAANTLLALGELREAEPSTRISWAMRGSDPASVYGGGDQDGLPARGALGARLRHLVEAGHIEVHTSVIITGLGITDRSATSAPNIRHDLTGSDTASELTVTGATPEDSLFLDVDRVVPTTGFRPDLSFLREIRLDLDPIVEAPTGLGPLIDPEHHSCGTVEPHGARLLAHPEKDFYIAGMKSYGRAPTFLMATGYEQVRSIVAAIAGDQEAADSVELVLPETGVCSADIGSSCDTPSVATVADDNDGCCGPVPAEESAPAAESSGCCGSDAPSVETAETVQAPEPEPCCSSTPQPLTLGIPTGLEHGRSTWQDAR